MGFLEDLRRKRTAEEARAAEQRDRQAQRQQAEDRRIALESEARNRRKAAEKEALQESVVPQVAEEMAELTGGYTSNWGTHMFLGYNDGRQKRFGQTYELDRTMEILGREDGSVQIGSTVLGSTDARNPAKVERALESAYRSLPTRRINVKDIPPAEGDDYPG